MQGKDASERKADADQGNWDVPNATFTCHQL